MLNLCARSIVGVPTVFESGQIALEVNELTVGGDLRDVVSLWVVLCQSKATVFCALDYITPPALVLSGVQFVERTIIS